MTKQQQSVVTVPAPLVEVQVQGNLKLAGWDQALVLAQAGSRAVLAVEGGESLVRVTCDSDAVVQVPRGSSVRLVSVAGDVKLVDIEGTVELDAVSGDAAMRRVGSAKLGTVAGDLTARDVKGDLTVGQVAGDARVEGVGGAVRMERVAADLYLHDVSGSVSVEVGADALLRLTPRPEQAYTVRAGADILCRLPSGAAAELELDSGTGDVRVRVPGAQALPTDDGTSRHISLGTGGPLMMLKAGADITIASDERDPSAQADVRVDSDWTRGFGAGFDGGWDVDLSKLTADLDVRLSALADDMASLLGHAGLSENEAERVAERVRQASDRALRHANHRIDAARRRAEHKMGKGTHRAWHWQWGRPGSGSDGVSTEGGRRSTERPGSTTRDAAAVSDAERAAVLRMLAQKQISAVDAEQLLAAMEGRS